MWFIGITTHCNSNIYSGCLKAYHHLGHLILWHKGGWTETNQQMDALRPSTEACSWWSRWCLKCMDPELELKNLPPSYSSLLAMEAFGERINLGLIPWRRDKLPTPVFLGLPCGSAGKKSTCNAGDLDSISGLWRSPWEGNGYPLQYSGLENSMDCIVHGVAKSQTWLSDFHFTFTFKHFRWNSFNQIRVF